MRLKLKNANTGEDIDVTFHEYGSYNFEALSKLDHFARDWRRNETIELHRDLYWALAVIRFASMRDGGPDHLTFLSGYRSRKTNDLLRKSSEGVAKNSLHIKGRAVDFVIPELPVRATALYVKWLDLGGVGHYERRFVHMDISDRKRAWGFEWPLLNLQQNKKRSF